MFDIGGPGPGFNDNVNGVGRVLLCGPVLIDCRFFPEGVRALLSSASRSSVLLPPKRALFDQQNHSTFQMNILFSQHRLCTISQCEN